MCLLTHQNKKSQRLNCAFGICALIQKDLLFVVLVVAFLFVSLLSLSVCRPSLCLFIFLFYFAALSLMNDFFLSKEKSRAHLFTIFLYPLLFSRHFLRVAFFFKNFFLRQTNNYWAKLKSIKNCIKTDICVNSNQSLSTVTYIFLWNFIHLFSVTPIHNTNFYIYSIFVLQRIFRFLVLYLVFSVVKCGIWCVLSAFSL